MLLRVPNGAGDAQISCSAVTAAITGTTVKVDAFPFRQRLRQTK